MASIIKRCERTPHRLLFLQVNAEMYLRWSLAENAVHWAGSSCSGARSYHDRNRIRADPKPEFISDMAC